MNYESKRITISFPAIERLSQAYGLPENLPSQTLAGYVERLIYECLCNRPAAHFPEVSTLSEPTSQPAAVIPATKPNLSKLAAMIKRD